MPAIRNVIRKIRHTVRYKLLVLVLFPILLVMPIALVLAIYWGANFSYEQLFIKVNTDLSVSHDVFERIKRDYLNSLGKTGESFVFRTALSDGNTDLLVQQIDRLQQENSFSYIHLTDNTGKIIHQQTSTTKTRVSSAQQDAQNGKQSSGIEIFSASDLAAEGLAEEVSLPLIMTARAHPTEKKVEDRGMMIRALYPIIDTQGKILAILDAGVLLNANFTFVDVIRDLVYGPGSLIEGSIGTVTVFLDDVRITTNVPISPGERALGTRVSDEVRSIVLDQGKTWIDRAFVVNDWYISSYEPIIDVDGKRVGMLYAGFLETPFRHSLLQALAVLVLLFFALMGLTSFVAVKGAKSIFKPIELMSSVVHATRKGEEKRIGEIRSKDEIGSLANEFDVMLDLLSERKLLIQSWAEELEAKVDERTSELKQKNTELTQTISVLQKTRQQLVIAEKLAALGELTAGVAHEINNPTAVMLGNLDVIVEEMGSSLEPVQDEIDLVIKQIYRIKGITNNLLQYAKPDTYAGYMIETDVDEVINETLKLVHHLRSEINYNIEFLSHSTLLISINQQELQQVLVNLIGNAIQALPEMNGSITISTQDIQKNGVLISIQDNGHGMNEESISKAFNPFYTTKTQGEGTGLGLSISYNLVRRYGGNIEIKSTQGMGTEFIISLLCEPVMMEDDKMIQEQLEEIEAGISNN
ncbi:MAG: GHKL domain-containing protein [Gammaproteobacteria bacterium]|jgi:two-component system NtrC family sensor kinase|nr:GHKL domain-containing protein [Gammaproteobacteria bacterium]MBT6455378.1 GHKL domain-containing protein [Gammaproteobacteria bacterium]MBT6549785.1 GHKL domain-containing protein [Gammaproteobacteria bacterium]MBT6702999.1 GHKL domain-containing protein [Gammaproteobacteria bacterium]MBT7046994.1 GHKL domain-containing protein [Gammaproteobacteria bacterium]